MGPWPLLIAALVFAGSASTAAASPCRWSWKLKGCRPGCAHQPTWLRPFRCSPVEPPPPPQKQRLSGLSVGIALLVGWLLYCLVGSPARPTLARTIYRLLFNRGRRFRGELTGLRFPVRVASLTGRAGAEELTRLLRHGGHLPPGVSIMDVRDTGALISDGVKGEKAILEVDYSGACLLPRTFFVKCNLPPFSAMRLLCEASEVTRCEARFYTHLAQSVRDVLGSPNCYFVDYSEASGEFLLVSEVVRFGAAGVLPLKHRIRDTITMDEQRAFVVAGATLNARLWGTTCGPSVPRFEDTHRRLWVLIQLVGRLGLHHTARRTLKGRAAVNDAFMTWVPPPELVGREAELISDMPHILRSLCAESSLVAFGHNDLTLDNAYFRRASRRLDVGVFDWQQACVNVRAAPIQPLTAPGVPRFA